MSAVVKGWASKSNRDWVGHIVLPSAFDESIKRKGLGGPKGIKMLWQHQNARVIGKISKLESRNDGVWLEANIDDDEAERALKNNGPMNFSVGFMLLDADISDDDDLIIVKGELHEVSAVTIPAQEEAVMTSVEFT